MGGWGGEAEENDTEGESERLRQKTSVKSTGKEHLRFKAMKREPKRMSKGRLAGGSTFTTSEPPVSLCTLGPSFIIT